MSTPSSVSMSPALRADVERWFARRGVPQLIEGYSSEPAMDARATPLLAGWLILGTIRDWGTNPDWTAAANALGIAATLTWMAVAWVLVRRVRGRPAWTRQATFDVLDIATMALLPAAPAAFIDGSAREAVTSALGALTGIGVVYVIVGFGVIEIGIWAVVRLWQQLTYLVGLVARTLPILLIIVVFLLFASELWQVAHAVSTEELAVVLLLLILLAGLFVGTAFRGELRQIEADPDPNWPLTQAHGTPVEALAKRNGADRIDVPRLNWLQRGNLTLLVVVPTVLQATFVAVVVMVVLAVFAAFIIPMPVLDAWIGEPPRTLVTVELLGEARALTAEMLIVCALLGGIVGLYFSGLAISDPAYRSERFDRDVAGVRELIAARAIYVHALRAAAPA
jgi:hypothetical protein